MGLCGVAAVIMGWIMGLGGEVRLRIWFEGAFEGFAEFLVFGDADVLDVWVVRVVFDIVLVVGFCGVEVFEGFHFGDDLSGEFVGGGEFGDLVVNDLFFAGVAIEDDGAVLGADVISLAVELSGVDAGEEGLDEGGEGYFGGVIIYLDGFGVAGSAGLHLLVVRVQVVAAGIARYDVSDAGEAFEDDLGVPEAAFGEVGDLFVGGSRAGVFGRNLHIGLGSAAGDQEEDGAEGEEEAFHVAKWMN